MVRYWRLSADDIRRINERRREYNRLGFAVQLCLLRYARLAAEGGGEARTQLDQDLNAMALNLVVAAVTLWNTAYLDRALNALEEARWLRLIFH